LPGLAVLAHGAADPGLALGLPGVPHAVLAAFLDDHGTVDVVLPAGGLVRAEDDGRLAPGETVVALHQGDALLGPPREPHAILAPPPQHRNIEAGAERTAENRVLVVLPPTGRRLAVGRTLVPSRQDGGKNRSHRERRN